MEKIYLYLARRDKKGLKILTTFPSNGKSFSPTRVLDLKSLGLDPTLENQLEETIKENKMMWEPWLELSKSYQSLKQSLLKRGYSNLPIHSKPSYNFKESNVKTSPLKNIRTMLKKGSSK